MADRSHGSNIEDFMLFYGVGERGELVCICGEDRSHCVLVFFHGARILLIATGRDGRRACALSHLATLLILEGFIIRGEEAGCNEVRCV